MCGLPPRHTGGRPGTISSSETSSRWIGKRRSRSTSPRPRARAISASTRRRAGTHAQSSQGVFEEGEGHIRAAGEDRRGDSPHEGLVHMLREQQGRTEELLRGVASFAARYPYNTLWHAAVAGYRASLKQREEARR